MDFIHKQIRMGNRVDVVKHHDKKNRLNDALGRKDTIVNILKRSIRILCAGANTSVSFKDRL